jgi:integrase
MKLDARTVAALDLPEGKDDIIHFDETLKGFGCRVRRQRDCRVLRTWVAQYRANGRTRRQTIGSVEMLKPAEAREAARRVLAVVALGGDPQGDKIAKRQQAARTLRSVIDAYLEDQQPPKLRLSSFRVTRLYLTGPYFKPLHSMSVSDISHPDVAARISAIERAHSTATAAAARRAVSTLFRWAAAEGLMGRNPVNPVIGTRKPPDPRPRDRVLSDAELVAIWNACQDDEYGRIIRLLILLGARREEIGGLCWSELDLDAGTWCLPVERSKNHRSHTITLPPVVMQILQSMPRQLGRDRVFGSRSRAAGFTAWAYGKRELDRRLKGSVQPWRVHDVRRTVATRWGDLGIQPHVIEAALNHWGGTRKGVTSVYNKSPYEREVTAALVMWTEHVLPLVEGRQSKVVPLRA